jgi:hypothetical protein
MLLGMVLTWELVRAAKRAWGTVRLALAASTAVAPLSGVGSRVQLTRSVSNMCSLEFRAREQSVTWKPASWTVSVTRWTVLEVLIRNASPATNERLAHWSSGGS